MILTKTPLTVPLPTSLMPVVLGGRPEITTHPLEKYRWEPHYRWGQGVYLKMLVSNVLVRGVVRNFNLSMGSKLLPLPLWPIILLYKKALYISGPLFSSKSGDSISCISKIHGFCGTHRSYDNYAHA